MSIERACPERELPRWRIVAVGVLLAVSFAGLLAKAGRLQLVFDDDLRDLAAAQYLRELPVTAPRGSLKDHHGRPLAVTVPAWSVVARPRLVDDKAAVAQALAPVLGASARELQGKLGSSSGFVWLKRRAAGDVADQVRALGLPGIELQPEQRRYWPGKELAGQLLGLVDVDGRARGGVERAYDDALQGRATTTPSLIDARGDRIALAGGLDVTLLEGDDVILTIDAELQHTAEVALADMVRRTQAKAGWAVVLDARTAALLAVANVPLFNPNAPTPEAQKNRVFAEVFEPASVMKVATFAAALDAGAITPADLIDCENGRFTIGKHVIHDTHPAGVISAAEVFATSSNIGALKIAQRLGEDRLRAALLRFGFGAAPGVGLVEEAAGRLPAGERWGDARLATVSFGHGVLVSALQIASLVQAVANDGVRRTPYLVERVESASGEVMRRAPTDEGTRVLSVASARTLNEIMRGVVGKDGTGVLAAIPGVLVAGKTGTAEKVDPVTKRYTNTLHLSSFVGFAPANDPAVVAMVVIDEPRGEHFGGAVAGPVFRAIMERALLDRGLLAAGALPAPVTPATAAAAAPMLTEGGSVANVDDPEPAPPTGVVPSLVGLTARAAAAQAEAAGLTPTLSGSGMVITQSPRAGASAQGGVVALTLADGPAPSSGGAR
ncbi:MAG: PASTA domain-containing protein [Deltaproteobacteria bacterium]|nr:PASTA domain-containing protein [Deltaproteobacteria bacterium]